MRRIPILIVLVSLFLNGNAQPLDSPQRAGIAFPGFEPVTLSLGGVRSLGFGDPVSVTTNPSAISGRVGSNLYSVCYGPVVTDISFMDGSGSHEESWVEALGSSSLGIDMDITRTITLGFAVARTSQFPFTDLYYIPEGSGGEQGSMQAKGTYTEMDLGCAWIASEWLVVGGAAGLTFYSQTFDIEYADTAGTITKLEYNWSEPCINIGISIPLEKVTLGMCWNSPDDYCDGILAGGGNVDILDEVSVGGEIELKDGKEDNVFTGRFFFEVHPLDQVAFRTGVSHTGQSEEISREGLGLSAGAGYSFGTIVVNTGFSWSRIRGDRDIYGYQSLDSYEGDSYIFSLGAYYTGPTL